MRLAFLLLALVLAGCAAPAVQDGGTKVNPLSGKVLVTISGAAYHPSEIWVKNGTVLRFDNKDDVTHAPVSPWWTLQTPTRSQSEGSVDMVGDFELPCAYHGIKTPLKLHVVA